tara:strand:+ start:594 stop:782 length:189 start_codon:yes stop_codon:yes gene_type:complete
MKNKKQIANLFQQILGTHKGLFKGTIEENYKLERLLIEVADNNINFKDQSERHQFIKNMIEI